MQAMSEQTYNGWKNYPTWCVNLWLSNDEGLYNYTREMVEGISAETEQREPLSREETIRYEVAESIKNFVTDDLTPDLGATFAADLLGFALGAVDWYEIADAWLEE